jgi:hypothetical protein
MWYDINQTLSHNCLFNFILGNRGAGKTYGALCKGIQNYIKKGEQFVYLRRYDTEVEKVKDNLLDAIIVNEEFPGHEFSCKGECYYLDGEIMGYAIALTQADYFKSRPFPKVTLIIYDEFIIKVGGTKRYLPNEVEKFLDLFETIARKRDNVTAFFLANNISFVNPYTTYFNLSLPYNSSFTKRKNLVLLQLFADADFIEEKKKTRFGQLVSGTKYGDYAIDNKSLVDNRQFIEKKTGIYKYLFCYKYMEVIYGVWRSFEKGKIIISDDYNNDDKHCYSLTLDDHTPNTMLITTINKAPFFKTLIDNYKLGNVYFENQRIKSAFYSVIKLITT